jgi:hypothetical protein
MDTLKKEIYIEARSLLESGEHEYLCHALKRATCNILGTKYDIHSDDVLYDLFPEFIAMDDGVFWHKQYRKVLELPKIGAGGAWWEYEWPEPRIAMIDYLLSR